MHEEHITPIVKLNLKLQVKFMWLQWCINTFKRIITAVGTGAIKALSTTDRNKKQAIFMIMHCLLNVWAK